MCHFYQVSCELGLKPVAGEVIGLKGNSFYCIIRSQYVPVKMPSKHVLMSVVCCCSQPQLIMGRSFFY